MYISKVWVSKCECVQDAWKGPKLLVSGTRTDCNMFKSTKSPSWWGLYPGSTSSITT